MNNCQWHDLSLLPDLLLDPRDSQSAYSDFLADGIEIVIIIITRGCGQTERILKKGKKIQAKSQLEPNPRESVSILLTSPQPE